MRGRSSPAASRPFSACARAFDSSSASADMSGSSAALMAMPKRLTGKSAIVWAYVNAETARLGQQRRIGEVDEGADLHDARATTAGKKPRAT